MEEANYDMKNYTDRGECYLIMPFKICITFHIMKAKSNNFLSVKNVVTGVRYNKIALFVFLCLVCLLLLFYSCQLLLCVLSIMSQFNIHPYYVYCVFATGNYCVLHHVIYRHTRRNGRQGIIEFKLIYKHYVLLVDDH